MRAALILSLLFLASCASGVGGQPSPIVQPSVRTVHEFEGKGVQGSVWIGPYAWTLPIRYWGVGTITLQWPAKPHVQFVGEGGYLVEPLNPGDNAALLAAMRAGDFSIVSDGQPAGLAPFGSINRSAP